MQRKRKFTLQKRGRARAFGKERGRVRERETVKKITPSETNNFGFCYCDNVALI